VKSPPSEGGAAALGNFARAVCILDSAKLTDPESSSAFRAAASAILDFKLQKVLGSQ